jgi:adenosylcobinamide kinase/adenosylcobinamide-phosphate guanylyltransferase
VITFVLGGARSGKSLVAERLASRDRVDVTYVATVNVGDDVDLAERVAAHQSRRLAHWVTVECEGDLADVLRRTRGTMLVDSLGPWVASLTAFKVDVDALCAALVARVDDTIIVSDEVGMGVHPSSKLGREFRDALGELNQAIASIADDVLFVVAGRVLPMQPDSSL